MPISFARLCAVLISSGSYALLIGGKRGPNLIKMITRCHHKLTQKISYLTWCRSVPVVENFQQSPWCWCDLLQSLCHQRCSLRSGRQLHSSRSNWWLQLASWLEPASHTWPRRSLRSSESALACTSLQHRWDARRSFFQRDLEPSTRGSWEFPHTGNCRFVEGCRLNDPVPNRRWCRSLDDISSWRADN